VRLGQIKDASIFTPEARELITASRAEAALQLEKALDANLPFREQLAKSLVDSTSLRDPRRSPLPGMSDYFDASLVQWIQKAVDATDDPATFTSLIEHEAEAQWTELASASRDLEGGLRKVEAGLSLSEPERLRYLGLEEKIQASAKGIFNWVIPAPTWSEVSGVREAPFSLKLSDLIVREGQDVPKHFLTFTVQLAFTSPAYFSSEEETSLPEPWEYEELKPLIEREVAEGIATDAVNQEILADALEFTLLQRLFRMALTGRLGEDFPCEKLAVLAEELAERSPTGRYPTQRWDYAGLEMPVSASAEWHLVQGLLAKFDLLPEELLGGEMKAADMQKLAEALNGIESKLSEHKDIADQDRAALTQGVLLLKRRLEQLAPCMQQAEAIKSGPQPRDRAQLESAWEKHLAPESWWKDWAPLKRIHTLPF
jgi:hypothetical protein